MIKHQIVREGNTVKLVMWGDHSDTFLEMLSTLVRLDELCDKKDPLSVTNEAEFIREYIQAVQANARAGAEISKSGVGLLSAYGSHLLRLRELEEAK